MARKDSVPPVAAHCRVPVMLRHTYWLFIYTGRQGLEMVMCLPGHLHVANVAAGWKIKLYCIISSNQLIP